MPATYILHSLEEFNEVIESVVEDFQAIELVPYMQGELRQIEDLHAGFFKTATAPNGTAWKENALRTIRAKGHSRVLFGKPSNGFRLSHSLTGIANETTGDAIREAIAVANGGMITFGTFVEYSVYNDQGTSRIPARPHIGLTINYLDAATERLTEHAITQLKQ